MDEFDALSKARPYIDIAQRAVSRSPKDSVLSEAIGGISTKANATLGSGPDDTRGLVFFARPDLNLTDDNLSQHRIMSSLKSSFIADSAPKSSDGSHNYPEFQYLDTAGAAIRSLLDRRGCREDRMVETGNTWNTIPGNWSSLVDPYNTFIPILTNQCKSLSGFPDTTANTKVTSEAAYGQQHIMADSRTDNYGNFKLTATFDEVKGRFITSLFVYWILYMGLIRDARNVRHTANIVNHRLDYNTRIFHVALDATRTKVTGLFSAVVAIPMGIDDGAYANYERDVETPEAGATVSVQFECVGVEKYDPITRIDFNRMVGSSKAEMYIPTALENGEGIQDQSGETADTAEEYLGKKGMIKLITPLELAYFKRTYPRISEDMDMQWWVTDTDYQSAQNEYFEQTGEYLRGKAGPLNL